VASPPAAPAKGSARRPRALHGAASASSQTPIVTTITKIVNVIPAFLWALIGGLLALALALGVRSRLSALRARRLEQQRAELLEDVGLLQAALLPVAPTRLGPVATSAAYRPADGPGAGGDFYDLFALDDGRLAVVLGDVSGHGRQALPHTALVRFTLRAYLEAGLSPRNAVQTAGTVLERQLGESFATVVAATYHPRERTLTYACAGHPPPIVIGSRAIEPITVCSAPPIGAGARTGTRQTVVSAPGRARVCFHTDGVTEARVGAELFGAQRLMRALAELDPEAGAAELLERVAAQTDSRPDDMAACLLSLAGGEAAPSVLLEELEVDREQASGDRIAPFLLACGTPAAEIAELVRATRVEAERSGSALLELRVTSGAAPEVTLRRDNVAFLHAPQMGRRVRLGGAR
jgi:serine phosphatase RsbU (regulator of sigma subunit)